MLTEKIALLMHCNLFKYYRHATNGSLVMLMRMVVHLEGFFLMLVKRLNDVPFP